VVVLVAIAFARAARRAPEVPAQTPRASIQSSAARQSESR
jgi:hypothetical protein